MSRLDIVYKTFFVVDGQDGYKRFEKVLDWDAILNVVTSLSFNKLRQSNRLWLSTTPHTQIQEPHIPAIFENLITFSDDFRSITATLKLPTMAYDSYCRLLNNFDLNSLDDISPDGLNYLLNDFNSTVKFSYLFNTYTNYGTLLEYDRVRCLMLNAPHTHNTSTDLGHGLPNIVNVCDSLTTSNAPYSNLIVKKVNSLLNYNGLVDMESATDLEFQLSRLRYELLNDLDDYDASQNTIIPTTKISYPAPFICSSSFAHQEYWFIHILHYQYWLWFFFISLIVFFFISFLCAVRWTAAQRQSHRETRGVSRSKCGDLITATVPVSWAASIIVSETNDAIDMADGFNTTSMVVGVRGYQWGWEYYYPKNTNIVYLTNTPAFAQAGKGFKKLSCGDDVNKNVNFFKYTLLSKSMFSNSINPFWFFSKKVNFFNYFNITNSSYLSSCYSGLECVIQNTKNKKYVNFSYYNPIQTHNNVSFKKGLLRFLCYRNVFFFNNNITLLNNNTFYRNYFFKKNNLYVSDSSTLINVLKRDSGNSSLANLLKAQTTTVSFFSNIISLKDLKILTQPSYRKITNAKNSGMFLSEFDFRNDLLIKAPIFSKNTSTNTGLLYNKNTNFCNYWNFVNVSEGNVVADNLLYNTLLDKRGSNNSTFSSLSKLFVSKNIQQGSPYTLYNDLDSNVSNNITNLVNTQLTQLISFSFLFKDIGSFNKFGRKVNFFWTNSYLFQNHTTSLNPYFFKHNIGVNNLKGFLDKSSLYLKSCNDTLMFKKHNILSVWSNFKSFSNFLNVSNNYNGEEFSFSFKSATKPVNNYNISTIRSLKGFNSLSTNFSNNYIFENFFKNLTTLSRMNVASFKTFKNNFDLRNSITPHYMYFNNPSNKIFIQPLNKDLNTIVKKKNNYFLNNSFLKLNNNFDGIVFGTENNFFLNYKLPFLLSSKDFNAKNINTDWFAKWNLIEMQLTSLARNNTTGFFYFNNTYDFTTKNAKTKNVSENYLTVLVRTRQNALQSNSSEFFLKNNKDVTHVSFFFKNQDFNYFKIKLLNLYNILQFSEIQKSGIKSNADSGWLWLYNNNNSINKADMLGYKESLERLNTFLNNKEGFYRSFFLKNFNSYYFNKGSDLTPNRKLVNLFNLYTFKFGLVDFKNTKSAKSGYSMQSPVDFNFLKKNQYKTMKSGINNMIKIQTSSAIILPVETRIQILASSRDVIHSWAIPSAGVKIDCIPGYSSHRIYIFFNYGIFWGQCMEICGRYHHWMPILVYFLKKDLFFFWCTHFLNQSYDLKDNESTYNSLFIKKKQITNSVGNWGYLIV